jgi:LPXTG-motif cell wall-anchored protein
MLPTEVIGGASQLLGAATQKSSPQSSAYGESSAASAMYGGFSTGDFSVGGISSNNILLIGIGVAVIAALLVLYKKHK